MTIRVDDLSITIAALEKLSKNNLMSLFIRRKENLDNTIYLSINLSIYQSIYLFIYLSINLFIYLSIYLSIYLII